MSPREPKNPRVTLLEDHRRIALLLDRLVATTRSGEREEEAKLWKTIESVLLRHLDVEEMFVFPVLREGHAAEIDLLRKQHDEIRKQIGEIGVALELHTLRCAAIESFCTELREHAEREESLAYVLAGRSLSFSVAKMIAARVKAVVTAARRAVGASTRLTRSAS
jgi:hemerythrin-like domain-containing protein